MGDIVLHVDQTYMLWWYPIIVCLYMVFAEEVIRICAWNYDWEKQYADILNESGIAPNIETIPFPEKQLYTLSRSARFEGACITVCTDGGYMYDGDNNRVFQIDNTYKWEDFCGDEVLIEYNVDDTVRQAYTYGKEIKFTLHGNQPFFC